MYKHGFLRTLAILIGRVCKKAIDFETNNKNGTKYANFDFGLEDYREMYHIIEKENNEK